MSSSNPSSRFVDETLLLDEVFPLDNEESAVSNLYEQVLLQAMVVSVYRTFSRKEKSDFCGGHCLIPL